MVTVTVPEDMVGPLVETVRELALVYGDGPTGDDLVGWEPDRVADP